MKNIYSYIIVLLPILNLYAQSTNHKIVYTASLVEQFTSEDNSAHISEMNRILEETTVEFELLINGNVAMYVAKDDVAMNDFDLRMARVMYGAMDKYYMDKTTQEFINQKNAYGDLFLLPMKEVAWELGKESKKIESYTCFKATTTYTIDNGGDNIFDKKVVAWYTPEINADFGPKGYHGLPGLILALQDENFLFTATEINLNKKKEAKISKPTKGKKMSIEEYDNFENAYTRGRE